MTVELQQETIPSTPSTGYGRLYADSTQKRMKFLDEAGLTVSVPGVLGVTTTSISSTTTAETKSLVGTITGTFTVPANAMVVGKAFRIKARGVISTGVTAGTIIFFLKYAGTTIASTGSIAPTTSQSNMYWDMDSDIVCRTIGASGTFFVQGVMRIQNATTPAAGVNWPIRGNSADPPAAVTVDTTASSLIDFQSTTSNNLHTVTTNIVWLEVLN